jgi:type I restriction enzyme, S subunit
MSFPRYPAYKDSGIEGLGQVPKHWEVTRIKHVIALIISGTSVNAVDVPAEADEVGVLKTSCVYTNKFRPDENKAVVADELHRVTCQLRRGSLIVSRMNTPDLVGASGYVDYAPENLFLPDRLWQVTLRNAVPKFFNYWMQSCFHRSSVRTACDGTSSSMQNLSQSAFRSFPTAVPPFSEQVRIADFLDRETAKIDALVAEQQRLIELLKEKRQAVISHAVTKGLNPDAPMKPSGMEWLGDVPAHWAVVPFAYGIKFQEGPGIMAADFCESGVPLVRVSGVQGRWASLEGCNYLDPKKVGNRWEHFRLNVGDLLISASASMGTVCEVGQEAQGAVPYTGLIRLMVHEQIILRDFIRAIVSSFLFMTQIDLLKTGATIQHFGPTHLKQMKVVLPPKDEQEMLAGYIERHSDLFNKLVAEAQSAIELLQERRLALISAAVTGQIDVRGLAQQEAA